MLSLGEVGVLDFEANLFFIVFCFLPLLWASSFHKAGFVDLGTNLFTFTVRSFEKIVVYDS